MYRVLEREGIEFWISIFDAPKQVRCFQGEIEIIIDLETLQILAYIADIPSGKLLNKTLKIVQENQEFLLQKWDDYTMD
jgi:hypothetical protein